MATLVHFDISAEDPHRAKAFYEKLFNWTFDMLPGPSNYFLIKTLDLQGNEGISGGMARRDNPQQVGITNFIGVASIDDSLRLAVQLGGKVIQPKQTITGWGYLAVCLDTENNVFGLFQEDMQAL